MKIIAVDIWTVVVPTIPGRVHSPELEAEAGWDMVPKHIIRVETDTELAGIGETQRGAAIEDVRAGARLLIGRDPESLTLQDIYATRTSGDETTLEIGQGPAYDTFEMAVFDLVGQARQVPVHTLLGGAVRDRVRADYWMGRQTPEDSKRSTERALRLGFKGVKFKCTIDDGLVARMQAICDVAGPEFKVTVDPNERFYTAAQTIELAAQLEPIGNVEVFEDPIPKSDLEGYIEIHETISQPLAMHLSSGAEVLRGLKAGVLDRVNLNGSLTDFPRNAAVAAAASLRCWHGSGNDLGIRETAYIHAASVAPNCTMASDFVGGWTREDDLLLEPIEFADGFTATPMQPGLGCRLDEAALERYTQTYERIEV